MCDETRPKRCSNRKLRSRLRRVEDPTRRVVQMSFNGFETVYLDHVKAARASMFLQSNRVQIETCVRSVRCLPARFVLPRHHSSLKVRATLSLTFRFLLLTFFLPYRAAPLLAPFEARPLPLVSCEEWENFYAISAGPCRKRGKAHTAPTTNNADVYFLRVLFYAISACALRPFLFVSFIGSRMAVRASSTLMRCSTPRWRPGTARVLNLS